MDLSPREKDKLLIFTAVRLEGARDGQALAQLMRYGTKLVSVHQPIA
ncbi:hypothetical protein [Pseudomonas sp. ENNP23]